jgi:uncharacterized SAM-binding protein YcdF (DUF218 family)
MPATLGTTRLPAAYRRRHRRGQDEPRLLRFVQRGVLLVLGVSFLVVAAYVIGVVAAPTLLDSEKTVAHADIMIVLGGDGPSRAAHAADLWRGGAAHDVLISGDGDCSYIAGAMIADAVSPNAITMECKSGSTWQNAEFSAAILSRMKPKSAVVVTNYFHERRALMSFRHFCPGVDFAPAPVPPVSLGETLFGIYGPTIMKEYVKVVVYEARVRLASVFGNAQAADSGACIASGELG